MDERRFKGWLGMLQDAGASMLGYEHALRNKRETARQPHPNEEDFELAATDGQFPRNSWPAILRAGQETISQWKAVYNRTWRALGELPKDNVDDSTKPAAMRWSAGVATCLWKLSGAPQDEEFANPLFFRLPTDFEAEIRRLTEYQEWLAFAELSPPDLNALKYQRNLKTEKTEASAQIAGAEERPIKPKWDRAAKTLTYNGRVAKEYRRTAKNQFAVLEAFELEGWPMQIDDPLPGGESAVERVGETRKALNTNLKAIEFRTNGNGTGFCWVERKNTKI